ncbi:hypothetical protein ACFL1T_02220, partial [Chlamydiota bacterium]
YMACRELYDILDGDDWDGEGTQDKDNTDFYRHRMNAQGNNEYNGGTYDQWSGDWTHHNDYDMGTGQLIAYTDGGYHTERRSDLKYDQRGNLYSYSSSHRLFGGGRGSWNATWEAQYNSLNQVTHIYETSHNGYSTSTMYDIQYNIHGQMISAWQLPSEGKGSIFIFGIEYDSLGQKRRDCVAYNIEVDRSSARSDTTVEAYGATINTYNYNENGRLVKTEDTRYEDQDVDSETTVLGWVIIIIVIIIAVIITIYSYGAMAEVGMGMVGIEDPDQLQVQEQQRLLRVFALQLLI